MFSIKKLVNFMYSKVFFLYQPKFYYGELCAYEALLRGVFYEGSIIYYQELMSKHKKDLFFNYFIINKVISDLVKLNCSGIRKHPVSINISAKFISTLIDVGQLDLQKINSFNLKLEFNITEDEKINDFDVCNKNISLLSSFGISVSLVDFSAGISSLERLSYLNNIKFVKLDKSLTDNIENNPSQLFQLETIYRLIKEFKFEVIAKDVETQDAYYLLIQLGIGYFQGFKFGRPLLIP
ncbi:EAL domain protein [Aliivibrio fischeri ES114]|uniref:EAL domain protein n=2 Tax=Aliivibrio fischeri TaxID=668 RepID=Q5DYK0_ALIF1|nr:EAL domain protein [Aliivibrio fischeri ES114]KLU80617.1 hypothetical protein AB192_01990 [Aliivibrio fischeri]